MNACAYVTKFWTSLQRQWRDTISDMRPILITLLLFISAAANAEIGGYRVEVILFQNLQANLDAIEIDALRNFSNIPDLTETNLPDDLEALTDKSQRMEGVWRRLRNSKGYRPLVYTSWVQNNIDYYPPFRIHDEVILDTQLRAPANVLVADLLSLDPLQAYRSEFYRLDGSAQLRLSRFLHINLDLEFRVPAQLDDRDFSVAADDQLQVFPEFDVHRLKQSRQVKTDRLQYFDSPWFGALILVIPIAAEPLPVTLPVEASPAMQQEAVGRNLPSPVQQAGQQQVQSTHNNQ